MFRENGIEPVLIKGWAAGMLYPSSHYRFSIDMDLSVPATDFDTAEAIARSASSEGLAIDLHRELRHLDTVEWDDLFEHSILIEIDGYPIRVLRVEDHLRVLCVHWLTDGGVNKERLWDIYYIIENRPVDFDWDRFLDPVAERRRRWLLCAIGLAEKYLGLELDNTPIAIEARALPQWLIRTVEKEWANETKHLPLEVTLTDPKMLIKQIERRIRPNPIWATVQMEGSFDAKTRVFYQVGSIIKRIEPSLRRIVTTIKQRLK
ncbi:hypothetical protein BH20ACI2_BH20ACI2_20870 [soil metagenome]